MDKLFFSAALVAIIGLCHAVEVPSFIHVCEKSNPDLKQCIINAVEDLRPYLQAGYPDYNIPSVEPIVIKDLIREESNGLKIAVTDVIAYGGGDYIVTDVITDFDGNKFEVDILLPKLLIDAKYQLDGKIVMVPIKGNGKLYANLTECSARAFLESEVYEKEGEQHMRFLSNKMKVKVGGGHVRLENLFNGDKVLSEMINDAVNKNLGPFIKELLPYIERALAANFLNTGNQIIEPYPMNQLFP